MRIRLAAATIVLLAAALTIVTRGGNPPSARGAPSVAPTSFTRLANGNPAGPATAPVVGETLTATTGIWTNSPSSFAYRWQRCAVACSNITGATGASYTAAAADQHDRLTVTVTASNSAGSASQRSAATGIVAAIAGRLSFVGNFDNGTSKPFAGVQCSNTGTPSKAPRYRGTFSLDTRIVGQGTASARITLPPTPAGYSLTACDLLTPTAPLGLNTDGYYGLMFYVPSGWTIPNDDFTGVEIEEFHFQNIYGAPIAWQLHPDHLTLALETGACASHTTAAPGCTDRSNADNPSANPGRLPAEYAIPNGGVLLGQWNEIVMHVHWASDNSGQIQTWYKVKGATTWNAGTSISGIPTVQWDITHGCCAAGALQETEAYTGAVTAPVSIWLDNDVQSEGASSSLAAVEATMP